MGRAGESSRARRATELGAIWTVQDRALINACIVTWLVKRRGPGKPSFWHATLTRLPSRRDELQGKEKGKQWWDGGALYLFDRHQQLIESPCMYVLRDFESCSRYSSPAITWLAAKEVKRTFLRAAILVLKLQTSNDHSFVVNSVRWGKCYRKTIHQQWIISPPAVQNGGDCGCYFYEESNLVVIGLWWLALP